MSWMQKLYETYENASRTTAVNDRENPLPAMGFILGEMPLTVYLSPDGGFQSAARSPKGEEILVPCTLESGVARQNPVRPHPLFDSAKYLGTGEQMELLKGWCDEPDTPEVVRSVYTYLQKGTLKSDLEQAFAAKNVKWTEKDGVKFCVSDASLTGPPELWRRGDVRESWAVHFINHCLAPQKGELCYVLGETLPSITKHPYALGNMYLISMSDENCEGRFSKKAREALSVSGEVSLKAHSALKWLTRRQGTYLGANTLFLAWDTGGALLPDLIRTDPADMDEWDEPEEEGRQADTWEPLGKALADGSHGYESRLLRELDQKDRGELSSVVVMVLDSASGKGRTAIAYYQELDMRDYLKNLTHWYLTCRWRIPRAKDGKITWGCRTPLPGEIGDLLYGTKDGEGDKKLKRQLTKRLIPCITARRPIPRDIVQAAFRKAVNPPAFKTRSNAWDGLEWERAVGVACALIRKQFEEEEHPMALDENNRERNYLYGRLLAVADVAEHDAMSGNDSTWRQTNASRYMQRFQQRPQSTWLKLFSICLPPYFGRLKKKSVRYTKLIDQITDKFQPGDMEKSSPLDVRFLEGYSCQKQALFQKGNDRTDNNKEDENDGGSEE